MANRVNFYNVDGIIPEEKNKILPGAFSLREKLWFLYSGGKEEGYLMDEPINWLVDDCSYISLDEENDVFAIGDDAIAGAYDLNGYNEEEKERLIRDIIAKENYRVYPYGSVNGLYQLEMLPFGFPMYYDEAMHTAFSTHVLVIKQYRKHLDPNSPSYCDVFPVKQPEEKQEQQKKKTLGSWLEKIAKRKNKANN